jgi:hypothetical protein
MKKRIFFGLAIAALAIGGFAIADNASRPTLTPSQLENIEALSQKEAWIEFEYDKICVEGNDKCVLSPMAVITGEPRS